MNTTPPTKGSHSPWGAVEGTYQYAPGIIGVHTSSHGGWWLEPSREAMIPAELRTVARQYAPAQWYEEDAEVMIPAVYFGADIAQARPELAGMVRILAETFLKSRRHAGKNADADNRALWLSALPEPEPHPTPYRHEDADSFTHDHD